MRASALVVLMGLPCVDVDWVIRLSVARTSGVLEVSGFNGPHQTILCGDPKAVASAADIARQYGAVVRLLPIRGAYHSSLMVDLLDRLAGRRPPGRVRRAEGARRVQCGHQCRRSAGDVTDLPAAAHPLAAAAGAVGGRGRPPPEGPGPARCGTPVLAKSCGASAGGVPRCLMCESPNPSEGTVMIVREDRPPPRPTRPPAGFSRTSRGCWPGRRRTSGPRAAALVDRRAAPRRAALAAREIARQLEQHHDPDHPVRGPAARWWRSRGSGRALERSPHRVDRRAPRQVALLLDGHGAQHVRMGAQLHDTALFTETCGRSSGPTARRSCATTGSPSGRWCRRRAERGQPLLFAVGLRAGTPGDELGCASVGTARAQRR